MGVFSRRRRKDRRRRLSNGLDPARGPLQPWTFHLFADVEGFNAYVKYSFLMLGRLLAAGSLAAIFAGFEPALSPRLEGFA
jgi:hypothetical protein